MRRREAVLACVVFLGVGFLAYNIGLSHSKIPLFNQLQVRAILGNSSGTMIRDPSRFPMKSCSSNLTYVDFGGTLTPEQTERVETCMIHYNADSGKGLEQALANQHIRYTSHTYLNNKSFVIEAGGHLGIDIEGLNSRYHPALYAVLEPVAKFHKILVEKFKNYPNIVLFNFGVDTEDGTFFANHNNNDGTSIFKKAGNGDDKLKIMSVGRLFDKLRVARRNVDLITLNCEGCEYAVLDLLLSTDYIRYFRNIQFQSHRISGICYPVKRFCWYQELLPKTHKLTFQNRFWWESWTQK